MSDTYDVIILGAGIVGAACAWEAVEAGLKTAIVEAGMIGGGATAAGMGHIVVMDDSAAQFALTRYSQQLWEQLATELPATAEYMACGTLWIAADPDELAEVHRKAAYYTARGTVAEILDAQMLAEAEPQLRGGLCGALWIKADGVVYPPVVARWLVERARAQSATVYLGVRAVGLGRGTVTLSDGTTLQADSIVNALGCWSPDLMPEYPVRKRKGHLVITDRYPGFIRHQLIELGYLKNAHGTTADSVSFNLQPRATGQILIGSSRQFDADDVPDDPGLLRRMLDRAFEYVPTLSDLSAIRIWTGFRPATPDSLPLIGPVGDGLYLATGHEGLGITTALGTAKLILDQILGRSSAIDPAPYQARRVMNSHA
jgi:glycine/D-amino acid oxidase-like deaminating enzyme